MIAWLAFFSLWIVFIRSGFGLRVAFLAAHVVNALLIVAVTEILSVFQALAAWPLALFWSVIVLINLAWLYRLRKRPTVKFAYVPLDAVEIVILAAVVFIVAVTGLIAVVAPPSNYDSMVYHLPRVAHWAFNGTVANYPTHTLRQLVIQPYSAYAILQTYILSGSDYFANLVQWTSMVASLAGVSVITGILGGSRRAQLLAVLFAATIPMGILQASSTQNDYLATLWAVCVAVFALLLLNTGERRWALLCALSFGLATLTKGIAAILGAPFLFWALWRVRWNIGARLAMGLSVILIVLLINAGFLNRLMQLSPDPFRAMVMDGSAVVERLDARGMVSNAVRGIATELVAPSLAWNIYLFRAVEEVHRWLGIGMNDPLYSLPGDKFVLLYWPCEDGYATSLIHSLLYLILSVWGLYLLLSGWIARIGSSGASPSGKNAGSADPHMGGFNGQMLPFLAAFFVSVILFCIFIKWQIYIPRFHLPFFVIFSAIAALLISRFVARNWPLLLLAFLMGAFSVLPLLYNAEHPVFPCGALKRSALASEVSRGGEIFDWLMKNGYFENRSGESGYLKNISDDELERLMQAYPVEYPKICLAFSEVVSFSRGLFSAPREEMMLGRFGKLSRDQFSANVKMVGEILRRHPGCRDVGFIAGLRRYEYPLWGMFNSAGLSVRVENVLVDNVSKDFPYPRGEPEPCLILKEDNEGPPEIVYRGRKYWRALPGPWQQVYIDPAVISP